MNKDRNDAFSLVGIGTAACIACCVGPILAFLGGLGVARVASTVLIGTGGLAITAAAVVAFVAVRRRTTTCAVDEPTPVSAPQRRHAPTSQEAHR
jgi:glycerol-3-phosphate acyltransferase PlsY